MYLLLESGASAVEPDVFGAIVICPDLFDPVSEGPCEDLESIWCCQLLVPTVSLPPAPP